MRERLIRWTGAIAATAARVLKALCTGRSSTAASISKSVRDATPAAASICRSCGTSERIAPGEKKETPDRKKRRNKAEQRQLGILTRNYGPTLVSRWSGLNRRTLQRYRNAVYGPASSAAKLKELKQLREGRIRRRHHNPYPPFYKQTVIWFARTYSPREAEKKYGLNHRTVRRWLNDTQ